MQQVAAPWYLWSSFNAPAVQAQLTAKRGELAEVAAAADDLEKRAGDAPEKAVGELTKKVTGLKAAGEPTYRLAVREAYCRC